MVSVEGRMGMRIWRLLTFALLVVCSAVGASSARAQWPERPITLVVPFAPGGATDVMGRLLAQFMSERLGKPVVVENRPGANTTVGTAHVAKSEPDGYTILIASPSSLVVAPMLQRVRYDPITDFERISIFGEGTFLFGAAPSVPAKTLPEFYAAAKASSQEFNYASVGSGSITHIMMEWASERMGVRMHHVPYNGSGGRAVGSLLTGDVQAYLGTSGELTTYIGRDQIRILAVSSSARLSAYPDIPTVAETVPGFSLASWNGIVAPKGTPQKIIDRLVHLVKEASEDPKIRARLEAVGITPIGSTPNDFVRTMQSDQLKFRDAIIAAKLKTAGEIRLISGPKDK
jgi:tripartite-type tricarboxylate transporter receptor subunit TctC